MKKEIFSILCSLFCFGYCFLIYSIKTGTRFYLIWGMGGCFFWDLPLSCIFICGQNCRTVCRESLRLLSCSACFHLSSWKAHYQLLPRKGEPNLDYLIVLGAQVKEKGPSAALKFRLDTAYDYLVENENTLCIVSGGQGANEPHSEAQGMYDYLVEKGIAKERIIMEDKSTDTSENIAFSSVFLDMEKDRVGIVTNNFHVFRGVHLAKHQGIRNVCGIAASVQYLFSVE